MQAELLTRRMMVVFSVVMLISLVFNVKFFTDINFLESTSYVPIAQTSLTNVSSAEMKCLAENIYHESGNQSFVGKLAVAMVTLNRVQHPDYPKTICGVVYQGSTNPNTFSCQFSWTCDPLHNKTTNIQHRWSESVKVAQVAVASKQSMADITEGATHFHAAYVKPVWAKTLRRVAQIDDHLFYKR